MNALVGGQLSRKVYLFICASMLIFQALSCGESTAGQPTVSGDDTGGTATVPVSPSPATYTAPARPPSEELIPTTAAETPTREAEDMGLSSTIVIDESLTEQDIDIGSAWVAYAVAHLQWIDENVSTEDIAECRYRGSFEEEYVARETLVAAWTELGESESRVSDDYLDQLVMVAEAGYLREYVWHYLGTEEWTMPDDLMMEAFLDWAEERLSDHQVETRAGIEFVGTLCSE